LRNVTGGTAEAPRGEDLSSIADPQRAPADTAAAEEEEEEEKEGVIGG